MSIRLRTRVFLYLLGLLLFFVLAQALIYAAVEYHGWVMNPAESLREGLEEVIKAVVFDL